MTKLDIKNYTDILELKSNIEKEIDTFSVEYAIRKVYPPLMKTGKFTVQQIIDYMTIKVMEIDQEKEWKKAYKVGEEYID